MDGRREDSEAPGLPAEGPAPEDLPPEELARLRGMLERLMELGIGVVYGQEEEGGGDAAVDCGRRLALCRAACCTFHFALTREEARSGRIAHDPARPFFIKREADGYCAHMDRETLRCAIWSERPARCRRYDCRTDPDVWKDPAGLAVNEDLFKGPEP